MRCTNRSSARGSNRSTSPICGSRKHAAGPAKHCDRNGVCPTAQAAQHLFNHVLQPALKVYDAQTAGISPDTGRRRMTAMTSQELGITSPAERAKAAQRRDATKRVRFVRDKVTSTSGTPAFDYELLRQFAQNRLLASIAIVLLVASVGALSGLWTGMVLAGVWMLVVFGIHGIII